MELPHNKLFYVSDRVDFENVDEISPKTQIQEQPQKRDVSLNFLAEATTGKKVAILIHGYNNTYEDAEKNFSIIIENLRLCYDLFVCYFWPAGGLWPKDYFDARGRSKYREGAGDVTRSLSGRLNRLIGHIQERAEAVDVIAHSMGCKLTLETLTSPILLSLDSAPNISIRNVFLLAPAVNDESLEKNGYFENAAKKAQRIFVFYSEKDDVLRYLFKSAAWLEKRWEASGISAKLKREQNRCYFSLSVQFQISCFEALEKKRPQFEKSLRNLRELELRSIDALGYGGSKQLGSLPNNVYMIDCSDHINGHSDYFDNEDGSAFTFRTISNILERHSILISHRVL